MSTNGNKTFSFDTADFFFDQAISKVEGDKRLSKYSDDAKAEIISGLIQGSCTILVGVKTDRALNRIRISIDHIEE